MLTEISSKNLLKTLRLLVNCQLRLLENGRESKMDVIVSS